jgi:hypothetical protein
MAFPGRVEALVKVPTGGAAFSASLGSLSSAVALTLPAGNYFHTAAGGVSSLPVTVQNLLNDNVQGYPASAAAMQAAVGYGTWSAGYLLNEASGSPASAFGVPATLTPASTPVYGIAGPRSGIDKAIGLDSAADALSFGNTFDLTNTTDIAFAWVAKHSANPSNFLFGKYDGGTTNGYALGGDGAGGIYWRVVIAGVNVDSSVAVPIGAWYAGMCCVERATGKTRLAVCPLTSSVATLGASTTIAATSVANAQILAIGASVSLPSTTDAQFAGFYVASGVGAATGLAASLGTAVQNFAAAVNASWTVSLDATSTTATGRYTISNSFWPAYVQFTNASLRDVLGYAYDFDYPQTPAQMATALGGYGTWTSGAGYLCNEAAGNPASVFGTPATLTANSLVYSQPGARGGSDKAIGFDAVGDYADGGSNFDVGANDLIIVEVGRWSAAPAGGATITSKVAAALASGWGTWVSGTQHGFFCVDGGGLETVDLGTTGFTVGEHQVRITVIDRSTGKMRFGTRGLISGTTTITAEATVSGSITTAATLRMGSSAWNNAPTGFAFSALYIVTGTGVATGLSANLSTALTNFATYMKSQTTTQAAKGLWIPDSLLSVDGDPRMAPLKTDKRQTRGPTGYVFGVQGNSYPRHRKLVWDMVTVDRVRSAVASYANNTWEAFLKETQWGMGSSWFTVDSLVQIYDHNNVQVGVDGAVAGWYLIGVDSFDASARKVDPTYTGLWRIEVPEISAVGS